MKAKFVGFEVGDRVFRVTSWGEFEHGTVSEIPDGPEVYEVLIQYDDGSYGEEAPEVWSKE